VKLSIIIPAYNEEKTIMAVVEKVLLVKLPLEKEIILVDDCSRDGTLKVMKALARNHQAISFFHHEVNKGKGASIITGLSHASGDIILIQDADLEYNPNDYSTLLSPLLSGKADVVYGSRFLGKNYKLLGHGRIMLPLHYIGNRALTLITNLLFGSNITDMETCYKVLRRSILKKFTLRAKRFDFEPEITAKILKNGYNILEVPITFKPRSFEEGKKITWRDGLRAGAYLLKYRFFD